MSGDGSGRDEDDWLGPRLGGQFHIRVVVRTVCAVRAQGSHAVVTVTGDLDQSTTEAFLARLDSLSDCATVDVDLNGVDFIDSVGAGALIQAHADFDAKGGRLLIREPSLRVLTTLQRLALADSLLGREPPLRSPFSSS